MICNGYKDALYIQMALLGRKLGKTIIMVVEKVEELKAIIDVSQQLGVRPIIGVRIRLLAKSSGKWATSGGENAKFGLSTSEVMEATELLKSRQMEDCLKLMHFHIGSQIPDIQTVKRAVREAARYYAKLQAARLPARISRRRRRPGRRLRRQPLGLRQQHQLHAGRVRARRGLQRGRCLQRGKGAAPDADQRERPRHRRASLHAGRRYLRRDREDEGQALRPAPRAPSRPSRWRDLLELRATLNRKNRREHFHDAVQIKDDAQARFDLGLLDLAHQGAGRDALLGNRRDAWSSLYRRREDDPG